MNVLVACEMSGRVRDAFLKRGHYAVSCDLLPSLSNHGDHYQGDIFDLLSGPQSDWDLMIAFPPCTHLSSSGARWWPEKRANGRQQAAVHFVRRLMGSGIPRIAIENPVGYLSTAIRKPDQIVQPWMFGEGEVKTTCLWLKNLPALTPTNVVSGREQRMWKMPPSPDRAQKRSMTYQGIADAMASQWNAEKFI
jgi:site-specific DNA-cytosine methylase